MACVKDISQLAQNMAGPVLTKHDRDYDQIRQVHNGMIDRKPKLIARCKNKNDVAKALEYGVKHGHQIAVRGGGHNVAGRAVCDGGLMIDLSLMKGIKVDPISQTVRAEAGVCWGEFNEATQAYGLATTGGAVSSTGIAGLTLGGGFGYLMGKHGYTIDNLLSVDLITPDGRQLTASKSENADLFWGLRGGGGNFGIATHFEYALHPVGPIVYGGLIAFDMADRDKVLSYMHSAAENSQPERTAVCSLTHLADGSGRKLSAILACHCGTAEQAKSFLEELRVIAPPVVDQLGPISYSELNTLLDAGFPKLALNYWKSRFIKSMSAEVVKILSTQFAACPPSLSKLIIERPHGAALEPSPTDTAFPHRSPGYSVLILGQWTDASQSDAIVEWVRNTFDLLGPHSEPGAYSNYLNDDEYDARCSEAFGVNLQRLKALKRKFDPNNVLHLNQNIEP